MKRGLFLTVLFYSLSLFSDPTEKYKIWAETISNLHKEITKLEVVLKENGFTAFQAEWKEVFEKKLIPQINTIPSLIVAVTGGTNTGKSSIYNYILDAALSSVSESAGHTKHTVLAIHP
jgi:ribosome biogenesis GTPase A